MAKTIREKLIRFENTPRRICTVIFLSCFFVIFIDEAQLRLLATLKNVFWPGDIDLWPMTSTFKLDLHILPSHLPAKNQVCMSVRSAVRVATAWMNGFTTVLQYQWSSGKTKTSYDTYSHTHTHTLTMSKLLHPSLTPGVKTNWFHAMTT